MPDVMLFKDMRDDLIDSSKELQGSEEIKRGFSFHNFCTCVLIIFNYFIYLFIYLL